MNRRLSIAALRRVVDGLRELPRRRSILLFSEGFALALPDIEQAQPQPKTSRRGAGHWNQELMDEYGAFTLHANRSGVTVNTIDPRGLIATFETAEHGTVDNVKSEERQLD